MPLDNLTQRSDGIIVDFERGLITAARVEKVPPPGSPFDFKVNKGWEET
jgi:hypothetical protein